MLQFICKLIYVLACNFLHSLVHHGVGRRISCLGQDLTAELVENGPHVLWALVTHFVDHDVKRLVQEGISWGSDALHDFGPHLSIIWYIQQRVALFAKLTAPLLSAFWTFSPFSQCKDSWETWTKSTWWWHYWDIQGRHQLLLRDIRIVVDEWWQWQLLRWWDLSYCLSQRLRLHRWQCLLWTFRIGRANGLKPITRAEYWF